MPAMPRYRRARTGHARWCGPRPRPRAVDQLLASSLMRRVAICGSLRLLRCARCRAIEGVVENVAMRAYSRANRVANVFEVSSGHRLCPRRPGQALEAESGPARVAHGAELSESALTDLSRDVAGIGVGRGSGAEVARKSSALCGRCCGIHRQRRGNEECVERSERGVERRKRRDPGSGERALRLLGRSTAGTGVGPTKPRRESVPTAKTSAGGPTSAPRAADRSGMWPGDPRLIGHRRRRARRSRSR